jgi:hypothetical protein
MTVADAEGRFRFTGLSAGRYFIRTEVTWEVPTIGIQGGLVFKTVDLADGQQADIVAIFGKE